MWKNAFGEEHILNMDGNEKLVFVLGDYLPTVYDVGVAIYSVERDLESDRISHCISAYVVALVVETCVR